MNPVSYSRPFAHVAFIAAVFAFASVSISARAQAPATPPPAPIPVEVAAVEDYVSTNLIISRDVSAAARLGFFHQSTLVTGIDDSGIADDLSTQSLLFYKANSWFRVTAGGFYATRPGFSPTVGVQFFKPGRNWFFLVSPRMNLESDPSYSVFSIIRYERPLTEKLDLYLSMQALNTWDEGGHVKSYQWLRLGFSKQATQFGLAVNLDYAGRDPKTETSVGLFVRREIF